MASNKLVMILLVGCWLKTFAQIQLPKYRYAVYFTDKNNNTFSLQEPQAFLSERSRVRRLIQNISYTQADLPVTKSYVDSLSTLEVRVWYTSKWLNAAYVICDTTQLQPIRALGFVKSVQMLRSKPEADYPKTGNQKMTKPALKYRLGSGNYGNSQNQVEMVCADQMHSQGFTGKGVYLAVFDGGFLNADNVFYFNHLFANQQIVDHYDFVRNTRDVYDETNSEHGTSVLSIIAAKAPGFLFGTAYDATFLLYRTEDEVTEYPVEEFNWLIAAERADSIGVDVINSSLGYTTFDDTKLSYTYSDLNGRTTIVARAAGHCARVGMVVVNSAGNDGARSWRYVASPADADSILAVGATDKDGNVTLFSAWGPTSDGRIKPDVSARGSGTSVGKSNNSIGSGGGTSFAAPIIAGLVAGLKQQFPELSAYELIQLIKSHSSNATAPDYRIGYGIPCFSTIRTAYYKKYDQSIYAIPPYGTLFPNPATVGPIVFGIMPSEIGKTFKVELYSSSAKLLFTQTIVTASTSNELGIEVPSLTTGLYFVKIWNDEFSKVFRLLKN